MFIWADMAWLACTGEFYGNAMLFCLPDMADDCWLTDGAEGGTVPTPG